MLSNKYKKVINRFFVLHPFLIAIYPILFLFSHNRAQVDYSVLTVPLGSALFLVVTICFLLELIFQNKQKSAVIASLFFALFFSYGHAFDTLLETFGSKFLWGVIKHRHLFPLWIIVFILAVYRVVKSKLDFNKPTRVLNIVSILLLTIPIASIIFYEIRGGRNIAQIKTETETLALSDGKNTFPDVYYIILDGYANSKTLKDEYGFDNSEFENFLEEAGFFIATESLANYPYSHLSLASSLNMQYLSHLSDVDINDPKSDMIPHKMIAENKVVDIFKSRGYKYIHFSSGWLPTNYNKKADKNIQFGVFDEFTTMLLRSSILNPFEFSQGLARERVLSTFDQLENMWSFEGPKFVFAHINFPHPPWILGHNGERIEKSEVTFQDNIWEPKERYLNQVIYANKRMKELIEILLKESKSCPAIVIQSDHGPGPVEDSNVKGRMRIFNAYLLPFAANKNLYESISPVNTFRVVFDSYFGFEFSYLEDESFFANYNPPYDFRNVTSDAN